MEQIVISFRGRDADNGHIDAFAGIESAAGIARALTLIGHYVATGTVRHRFPFDPKVQFFLEGTEEGSFNWTIALSVAGSLALGLTTNAIYDIAKVAFNRAIGEEPASISEQVNQLDRRRSGDIDALIEVVEPALKKAHYGIGETANKIVIQKKRSKENLVEFNFESKSYLNDSVEGDDDIQDVSISALNVNDKTGRAYFLDLGRTVPFRVSKDADPDTMTVLSKGLDRYANNNVAPIQISFVRVEAVDGRLKKVIIFKAVDISEEE